MERSDVIQKIVAILNDFYGEENVDLQSGSTTYIIYIRFPKVTVTNEHDNSIDITELYAKLIVDSYGLLISTFSLNRAEYTATQWINRYKHSHVPSLEYNSPSIFSSPCLGSGPIRSTILSLNGRFDEDLWNLFAFELNKYVHTESLTGGPYKRLEEAKVLRSTTVTLNLDNISYISNPTLVGGFINYVLKHNPFKYCFTDNKYSIAANNYTAIITLSNMFIAWFNNLDGATQDILERGNLIVRGRIEGNTFISPSLTNTNTDYVQYIGTPLWTFKGQQLRLNIINDIQNSDEQLYPVTLLDPATCIGIIFKIEKLINYHYGTAATNDPIREDVIYL